MSSYDQNLLDEAPKATRAQLQEGYNVDLLEQPPRRTPSMRIPAPQIPYPQPTTTPVPLPLTPVIPESGSKEKFSSPAYISADPKPRTSFWRTRKGIVIIAILILVIVGAVVGGAVGGTVGKNSSKKVDTTTGVTSISSAPASSALSSTSTLPGGSAGQGSGSGNTAGFATPSSSLAKVENTGAVQSEQNIIN